jgi:serine/threonine-protein kinase
MTRLTFAPGTDNNPVWTPDGRRIAFNGQRDGGQQQLLWQSADGTGTAESLTNDLILRAPSSFSPDGTRLLFNEANDVGAVILDDARRTEMLLKGSYNEGNAEVSPDGRWLAYQSAESGRPEIYVRPFPNVDGGKWQVSMDGGTRPLWARSGRELFYFVNGRGVMGVPIHAGPTFTAGAVQTVVSGGDFITPNAGRQYDVSPDGQRFLLIKEAQPSGEGAAAPPLQLVVIQNWLAELKRLVLTN